LSAESSAEPGRWKTSKAEYQRGMMDSISDRRVHTVVIKSSAQIGKTEMLLNIAGYYIDQNPSPMLFLQPTVNMALSFSKDRLTPACRDSPRLAGKLTDDQGGTGKATKKGSTLLQKVFPGGHISLAGMNSASELASRPVKVVLIDEVDRAPVNVGGAESGEGDPVSLARKRSQTFWNRKTILVSTPTIEGMSRIDDEWEESDKRHFHVPCPHCGDFQVLEWKQVKWPKDEPHLAQYCCPSCGALWTDAERWGAVSKGHWEPSRPEVLSIAGFHINEMYSPWSKLGDMATNFMIAKRGGPEQLKTWVNTALGECWSEDEGERVEWDTLYNRREHYPHGNDLPDGVSVLVAGVDVQDDRIEYEVVGYGAGETSWGIKYRVLIGDPGQQIVWTKLEQELRQDFQHPSGHIFNVRLVCIDSGGHYTDEVYQWSKKVGIHWAIPVKGSSEFGKQIARYPRRPGKEHKTMLTLVGTDTAKELIYSRFRIRELIDGYCHFPVSDDYDETYFRQVTSEKRIRKYRKGVAYFEWDAGARRNEALDCRVYALAALRILIQHRGLKLGKMPSLREVVHDTPEDREEVAVRPKQASKAKSRKHERRWAGYEGKW
jgi:phage terminase large subunit GpA-like protein